MTLVIEEYICQRFPLKAEHSAAYRNYLIGVCRWFNGSGRADNKFVDELTSGKDSKFWSCISEALIAERLKDKTWPERKDIGIGPDFLVLDGDTKVWIEVICPEPKDVPEYWLNFDEGGGNFPHEKILLRWTAAIKAKAEKLIGNESCGENGYIQAGIVDSKDAYVIAVNGCQLRNGPFPALMGISQFPFAFEAVFSVGPIQLTISKKTQKVIDRGHQSRPYIINKNNAQVSTQTFLDPKFKEISAIWAVDANGSSAIGGTEPMAVVHNPLASTAIPVGFLPANYEYVTRQLSDNEYSVEKIDR